jgi:hypothetical protein
MECCIGGLFLGIRIWAAELRSSTERLCRRLVIQRSMYDGFSGMEHLYGDLRRRLGIGIMVYKAYISPLDDTHIRMGSHFYLLPTLVDELPPETPVTVPTSTFRSMHDEQEYTTLWRLVTTKA